MILPPSPGYRARGLSFRTGSIGAALLIFSALSTIAAGTRADASADEAKRHFVTGVRLYQDKNFGAALAEFEASNELKPTAVAMQNLAVCQKALFRYVDAIGTLEKMLKQFGASLGEEDKQSAEKAIRELNALLGTIVLDVDPPFASVAIDGAPASAEAVRAPVRLAPGDYKISAEATGYKRLEKSVRVASGQRDQRVALHLAKASDATVAPPSDPEPIPADRAAPALGSIAASAPAAESSIEPKESAHGLYGLVALTAYAAPRLPAKTATLDSIDARSAGGLGFRFGYRKSDLFAIEAILEGTTGKVAAACTNPQTDCEHDLSSVLIGAGARFSSSGARARLFGLAALGLSSTTIKASREDSPLAGRSGLGPAFSLEGGIQVNFGHALVEGAVVVSVDGSGLDAYERKAISHSGLSLRAGYGQW